MAESPSPERPLVPVAWIVAAAVVALVWTVLQFPYGYSFQPYVLFDTGWALTTDALLDEGLVPTVDFAYFYGLLTLAVDRLWFKLFGPTPAAQAGLSVVCAAAMTYAVIRFAVTVRLRPPVRWLLLAYFPLAFMPGFFPTPAHALEPALLANALVLQLRGKPDLALVLATICLFVKSALVAIYGPILVGVILFGQRDQPTSLMKRLLDLVPAAVVGLILAGGLAWRFGTGPLMATLLPLEGGKLYAAEKYGFFFGTGRHFWWPEQLADVWWWYYQFTPAGFWIVATLTSAALAWRTFWQGRGVQSATVLVCIALHLVFVFLLFGNDSSWKYYTFLLAFGVCGVLDRVGLPELPQAKEAKYLHSFLAVLAVAGIARQVLVCANIWATATRPAATNGLFASPADATFWADVREQAKSKKVLVLSSVGAAHCLFPEVESPRSWFLLSAIAKPAEVERLKEQIHAADWMIVSKGPNESLATWPELKDELGQFAVVNQTETFILTRRVTK